MKTFLTLLSIITIGAVNAQDSAAVNNGAVNNTGTLQRAASAGQSSYGASTYFVNPARPVEGSIYLFDKWENRGVLVTIDKQRYGMKNINTDLKNQAFQSRFSKDSMFNYNFTLQTKLKNTTNATMKTRSGGKAGYVLFLGLLYALC